MSRAKMERKLDRICAFLTLFAMSIIIMIIYIATLPMPTAKGVNFEDVDHETMKAGYEEIYDEPFPDTIGMNSVR